MMLAALEYRLARAMEALESKYKRIAGDLEKRVDTLEERLESIRAVIPPDILAVAKVARTCGTSLSDLRRRLGKPEHAAKVNRLFARLRDEGWSIDRIARASGYSNRGVVANLRRFSNGSS